MARTRKIHGRIVQNGSGWAVVFWLVQVVFGLPALILAIALLISGRADGALYSIAFFLAWIGLTLTFGIASVMHGARAISLPGPHSVYVVQAPAEADFDDTYNGYPYRSLGGARYEALTESGLVTFESWGRFADATTRGSMRPPKA